MIFGVLACSAGLFLMSALQPGDRLRHRGPQPRGAEPGAGVPVRAHQHHRVRRIPKERTNYATGLFNLARNIGGSSGIAAVTTMLARRAQFHQTVLVAHLTPYDAAYRESLARTAGGSRSRAARRRRTPSRQAHGLLYATSLRQSSMLAFADAFWLMAVLFLAIVPLMFLMKRPSP